MTETTNFNELQLAVLAAAMNRIIPQDDYPGAKDAGGIDFILRLLQSDEKSKLELYNSGLLSLNLEAKVIHNSDFVDLTSQNQDDLLAKIERGEVKAVWNVEPTDFFSVLVRHTAEGYYSDPGNGGNTDEISWRMIGFST